MKKTLILISAISLSFVSYQSFAAKPEWAGKGAHQEKAHHKAQSMENEATEEQEGIEKKLKKPKEDKHLNKTTENRKEAGKGSEKGQQMREEHSKKWWHFWK